LDFSGGWVMRRRYSAEEWRAWFQEQPQSGLTVADFCDEIGVSPNSFYLWRRKLSAMPQSRSRSVPSRSRSVSCSTESPAADTPTFLPLQVVATGNVEIELPCGAVIRIPPESGALPQILAALLQAGEPAC
jgi:transposase-like protein